MAKRVIFNTDAKNAIQRGVKTLAGAVKVTLGPKGKNVMFEKTFNGLTITKDGVSVAEQIQLEDVTENMGAQAVIQVAKRTNDVAGDGTTTATVLAEAILNAGLKNLAAGANPMDLKRGIDLAAKQAIEVVKKMAKPVSDELDEITEIASISANSEREIGELIGGAMKKVGRDGVITVEESNSTDTTIDVVEGFNFDRGYISPYFVTDPERMVAEYEDVAILVYEGKIKNLDQIVPILEPIAQQRRSLLIICEDLEGSALPGLVVNRLKGGLQVVAVKATAYGDRRKEIQKDIAIAVGATYVSPEAGVTIKSSDAVQYLGTASKVVVTKDETTIIEGGGRKDAVKARIDQIKAQLEQSLNDYDKQKLVERIAMLSDGVAVIKIGAASELEMKEKKDRVDDALAATKAAIAEGIVPGGGLALLNCYKELEKLKGANEDQNVGIKILRDALLVPMQQIAENAGDNGSMVVAEVLKNKKGYGYNAATGKYVDLIADGIIDPAKVTRVCIENAASISSLLLTTECILADIPEKDEMPPIQGGGMPNMM